MEDELTEGKLFATFEKYDEYVALQASFLSLDLAVKTSAEEERREILLLQNLTDIVRKSNLPATVYLHPTLARRIPGTVISPGSFPRTSRPSSRRGPKVSCKGRSFPVW